MDRKQIENGYDIYNKQREINKCLINYKKNYFKLTNGLQWKKKTKIS